MPKSGKPPAFLFYPDDFVSDGKVEAMSTEEVGAYILLLCKSWRESPPGSIPTDESVLARWARLTPDRWSECRTAVLAAFTFGNDSRWHQRRLRSEYDKLCAIRRERTKAAKSRWNKDVNANALQKECVPSSIPKNLKPKATSGAQTAPVLPNHVEIVKNLAKAKTITPQQSSFGKVKSIASYVLWLLGHGWNDNADLKDEVKRWCSQNGIDYSPDEIRRALDVGSGKAKSA